MVASSETKLRRRAQPGETTPGEARAATERSDRANRQSIRAIAFGMKEDAVPSIVDILKAEGKSSEDVAEQSKQLPEDPFHDLMTQGMVIEAPFDMLTLSMLPEHNSELNQVIEAMETNIEGFGHTFRPRVRLDDPEVEIPPELKKELRKERIRLDNFFNYASMRDSFTRLRRKTRRDIETTGNGYWEVIRNAAGRIQGFEHIPSYQMRLTHKEKEAIEVDWPILEIQEDESWKIVTVKRWVNFRKFVQARFLTTFRGLGTSSTDIGLRYFKEFGDPRVYDNRTGKIVDDDSDLPEKHRANEVIHWSIYSARTPYGLPRYIGNLLSIFGDRAAEEINYTTFRNNNVPSMMLLVSNGQLTDGTIDRIKTFVESHIQGSDNYSKILIIEAEGNLEGEDGNNVKVDAKPLVQTQHRDALFQNYSKNNQDKVRRAYRLPPIFVGRSDDYTRATAESSRKLADEQVFAPERDEFDSTINRQVFPHMGIVYHRFKSNSPNTTDNEELVKTLAYAEKTGGMTPRIARMILTDVLGVELPPFPAGFDPDVPFSLTMAEAVKNQADPTEPGQQVTALKVVELLKGFGVLGEDNEIVADIDKRGDEIIERMVRMRKKLEQRWREQLTEEEEDDLDD